MSALRPATTVLLLRERADDFEIFLVQRHRKSGFLPSAWVFPGGRVDEADALADHPRIRGGATAVSQLGLERGEGIGYLVAGVRETFEEAGIWLGSGTLPAELRRPLAKGELALSDVLDAHDVHLDLDLLFPWSRWITPEIEPKRYDTRFVVARAEDEGVHDDHETVDSGWYTASEILEGSRIGRFPMAPPTWWTVRELAACGTIEAVIDSAAGRPQRPIQPIPAFRPAGLVLMLPGHPEHPEPAYPGLPTEVRFDDGTWKADGSDLPNVPAFPR